MINVRVEDERQKAIAELEKMGVPHHEAKNLTLLQLTVMKNEKKEVEQ